MALGVKLSAETTMSGSASKVVIRPGRKEDCPEIQRLIQALADFEKCPDGPKLSIQDLERDGFECNPARFKCFVAEDPEKPATLCGFTLYYLMYSAWKGNTLGIDDLFVEPEFRGSGLGKRLLAQVAKVAHDNQFCRIQWTALSWNPACSFYQHLGARNVTTTEERVVWRLYGDSMAVLADFAN